MVEQNLTNKTSRYRCRPQTILSRGNNFLRNALINKPGKSDGGGPGASI